jgi:hypothetical protein
MRDPVKTVPKGMFGFVVKDGMKWSGIVTNQIPLFGFVKNKWSGMKPNGTHSIPFHPIILPQFGVYGIECDFKNKILPFCPYL